MNKLYWIILVLCIVSIGYVNALNCVVTCSPGAKVAVFSNWTLSVPQMDRYQNFSAQCKYQVTSGTCTITNDCQLFPVTNSSGASVPVPADTSLGTTCIGSVCAVQANTVANDTYYTFDLRTNKPSTFLLGCKLTSGGSGYNSANTSFNNYPWNSSLIRPVNGYNNSDSSTVNFWVNTTKIGVVTMSTYELRLNNSLNATVNSAANATFIVTFDQYGEWIWSVFSNTTRLGRNYTDNANYTFYNHFYPSSSLLNGLNLSGNEKVTLYVNASGNTTYQPTNVTLFINGTNVGTNVSANWSMPWNITQRGYGEWIMQWQTWKLNEAKNLTAKTIISHFYPQTVQNTPTNNSHINSDFACINAESQGNWSITPTELKLYINDSYKGTVTWANLSLCLGLWSGGQYWWNIEACKLNECLNGTKSTFFKDEQPPTTTPSVTIPTLDRTGTGVNKNLTAHFTTTDSETNITDFRLNNISIAHTYSFDTPDSDQHPLGWTRDYSTFEDNFNQSTNPPNWTTIGIKGGAYFFKNNQYMTINNRQLDFENLEGWTISFWLLANTSRGESRDVLVKTNDFNNNWNYYSLYVRADGSSIYLGYEYNRTIGGVAGISGGDVSFYDVCEKGKWCMLTLTYNNQTKGLSVFVNGTFIETEDLLLYGDLDDAWFASKGAGEYTLGAWPNSTAYYNVSLDEFKLFTRELNESQVRTIFVEESQNRSWTTLTNSTLGCGENWSVAVTPNDLWQDGTTKYSEGTYIDCGSPNITLWKPNNVSYHYKNITFYVNTSGPALDNLSIYVNGTLYYTQYNNSNLTVNLTINQTGNLTWTVIGCKEGTCYNAWNEYYWFQIYDISNSYAIWAVSGALGIFFLRKKKWIYPMFLMAWGIGILLIEQSTLTNIGAIFIPFMGVAELVESIKKER